jgi:hypothetical protein
MPTPRKNPVRTALLAVAGLAAHVARRTILTPRAKLWMRRAFVGGLALTAALVLASAAYTRWTAGKLEPRLAAMKAAGLPLTPLEAASPPVPEAENAAPLWNRAFALWVAYPHDPGHEDSMNKDFVKAMQSFLATGDTDEAGRSALSSFVASNADALAQAELAAARPQCRFDVDYTEGLATPLPHLLPLRRIAGAACMRAVLGADHDADAALRSLEVAHGASHALENEPFLISALVRKAIDTELCRGIEHVLAKGEPSEAACRRLLAVLAADRGPRAAILRSLDGERAGVLDFYQHMRSGRLDTFSASTAGQVPWLVRTGLGMCGGWLNHDELVYLDWTDRVRDVVSSRPLSEIGPGLAWTENALPESTLSSMMIPAYSVAVSKLLEEAAHRDAARLALALRISRLRHGAYPEALDALVPDVLDTLPEDPFAGKAFHYRREGPGFVVWSVGPNGKDEQGRHGPGKGDADDVGLAVGR